jgi:hypothetical protein
MFNTRLKLLGQFKTYHLRKESAACAKPKQRLSVKELIELIYKK